MSALRRVVTLAGRELLGYFLSPIAWVVLALFLFLEGFQFVLFLRFLSQPGAPHGDVMQYLFGGTILFWVGTILVATLIPMRLLAEERRTGTLESLLTAPVTTVDVVLGKWLGALAFYVALWLPTLVYVVILWNLAPAAPDPRVVLATYAGVLLTGGAFLAVGLLASATTSNQVVAAVLASVGLLALVLVGVLDALPGPEWLGRTLSYVNLLHHMEDVSCGILDTRPAFYLASLTTLALFGAVRVLDRPWAGERRWGVAATLLAGIALVLVNLLAARHYARGDVARARVHDLSPKTDALLDSLGAPVEAYVFMTPTTEESAALMADVREILERMQHRASLLTVRFVDKDGSPDEARALKSRFTIDDVDLANGVVVFASGDRSRYVAAADMADYQDDPEFGGRRIVDLKAEGAFDGALLAVTRSREPELCFTRGHDEEPLDPGSDSGDYGTVARDLRRDGYQIVQIDGPAPHVPERCDAVVVGGARRRFTDADVGALEAYLGRGGRMLVLADATAVIKPSAAGFAPTGLEPLLVRYGARVRDAVAIDLSLRPQEDLPLAWRGERYGMDDIGRALAGRPTSHSFAQVVEPVSREDGTATSIVETSDEGWGETDLDSLRLAAPLAYDPGFDLPGPVSIGVAAETPLTGGGRARIVVLGDALSYVSSALEANADYDADLLLASCAWLCDEPRLVDVGPRIPEQMKLSLSDATMHRIEGLTLLALPLGLLLVGMAVVWVRRR